MKRHVAVVALAFAAGAALAPETARADTYKDEKLGYEIRPPRKWERMPLAQEGDWLVARFLCDREYEAAEVSTGFYSSLRPNLDVVVLPNAVTERSGAEVEKKDDGEIVVHRESTKSIRAYLEEYCRGIGGFHFVKEEDAQIDDMVVHQYEITVDKLVTGERRVLCWAFEGPDAEWGLISHFFADHEKKLAPDILAAFRTFKLSARTGALPGGEVTGSTIRVVDPDKDDEERTPEERQKDRDDAFNRMAARIRDGLPKDWTVTESKHFLVVSHADKRFTKGMTEHAEALRKWLDDNLDFLGDGYVGKCILRICADNDEYVTYQNSRGWFSDAPEVVTYKSDFASFTFGSANRELYRAWLRDKDERFGWGAPAWLENGLADVVSDAYSKGNKIVLVPYTGQLVEMAQLEKQKKLLHVRDFFTMTSEELFKSEGSWSQLRFFAEFLVAGKASRSKRFRDVLPSYFAALDEVLREEDEREKAEHAEPQKQPESEEEEDALFKARQTSWRAKEKEKLQSIVEKAFGDFTEKDWDALDRLYRSDLP